MTSTKDNHSPIAKIKYMKFCDLADKRIQKSSFEETKEQQENIERQFNKIRKTVHEQNLNLNEEIEIMQKNQTEILELKNSMSEMKNAIQSIYLRIDWVEDRTNELEDRKSDVKG